MWIDDRAKENAQEKNNQNKYKNAPSKVGAILILTLLCLHPYIQMIKYIDFCLHKEQIVITQTVCEGFTWNDDNSYYDGVDYLNFSVEVSFKRKEIVSFNAHTLVFKDDKYLGYINSDFIGTSQRVKDNTTRAYFETNTTQKLYFHISHPTNTSWQNDELFKKLYYGNLDDFKFVTNIICVYFTDGTMVGHYLSLPDDFYYDENGMIYYKDQKSDKKRYYCYDDSGKKHYAKQ